MSDTKESLRLGKHILKLAETVSKLQISVSTVKSLLAIQFIGRDDPAKLKSFLASLQEMEEKEFGLKNPEYETDARILDALLNRTPKPGPDS